MRCSHVSMPGLIGRLQQYPIHATDAARGQLRRADVHHDRVSAHPGRFRNEAAHRVIAALVVDEESNLFADTPP